MSMLINKKQNHSTIAENICICIQQNLNWNLHTFHVSMWANIFWNWLRQAFVVVFCFFINSNYILPLRIPIVALTFFYILMHTCNLRSACLISLRYVSFIIEYRLREGSTTLPISHIAYVKTKSLDQRFRHTAHLPSPFVRTPIRNRSIAHIVQIYLLLFVEVLLSC